MSIIFVQQKKSISMTIERSVQKQVTRVAQNYV